VIISHRYKFIFIKTSKTAGTSIEVLLSGLCGDDDIVTPIFPHVAPHRARNFEEKGFKNHMAANDISSRIDSSIWRSYYKFCVERNPWDKVLSHFHMHRYRAEGRLTLEEYFEDGKLPEDFYKYTDSSGDLVVDRVVKYENLETDLAEVFGYLGVPFCGKLNVRAKSEYRADRRHYSEVLTSQQADVVAKAFEREIALFGYQF